MNLKIATEVRRRFARIMDLDETSLDLDADLGDTYGVDSLNALRLVSELEVALGVDIPEDELQNIRTLKDVVRLCEAHPSPDCEG
jgi:acyl carrier protein